MAPKTSVEGNLVKIDDGGYIVKPAGTDRYAVFDDFGGALGYFTVRGKVVTAEDYGVAGAHPLVQIGRLWRGAQDGAGEAKVVPPSKMVCEVLTLTALSPDDLSKARAHRQWLKAQPGLKAAFYAQDAASGKALAIRVWANRAQLDANNGRTPPDGAAELPSSSVDVLALIEDL